MSLGTLLLIVLILMLVGVLPTWPHSRNWGYAPMGGLGLAVLVVVVLLLWESCSARSHAVRACPARKGGCVHQPGSPGCANFKCGSCPL